MKIKSKPPKKIPERLVKTQIKVWLRQQGFYHFSPIGGPYSVHGVPDIIVCAGGKFVGIECKSPDKTHQVTKHQADHINRIQASDGVAFVAYSLADVIANMKRFGIIP